MTIGALGRADGWMLLGGVVVLVLLLGWARRREGAAREMACAVRWAVLALDLLLLLGLSWIPAEQLLGLRRWLGELADLLLLLERTAARADNKLDTRGDPAYNDARSPGRPAAAATRGPLGEEGASRSPQETLRTLRRTQPQGRPPAFPDSSRSISSHSAQRGGHS